MLWGAAMADYRVYLIGADGHIFKAVGLVCADDAEAIKEAKRLSIDHEFELWQLDRKVARLNRKPK
jgi:hypothetical protein